MGRDDRQIKEKLVEECYAIMHIKATRSIAYIYMAYNVSKEMDKVFNKTSS